MDDTVLLIKEHAFSPSPRFHKAATFLILFESLRDSGQILCCESLNIKMQFSLWNLSGSFHDPQLLCSAYLPPWTCMDATKVCLQLYQGSGPSGLQLQQLWVPRQLRKTVLGVQKSAVCHGALCRTNFQTMFLASTLRQAYSANSGDSLQLLPFALTQSTPHLAFFFLIVWEFYTWM